MATADKDVIAQFSNAHAIEVALEGLALAYAIVDYFGDEDIPASLDGDIALRDSALALIARAKT